MNKINAVIFDMDGVIFDTEKVYLDEWKEIFKEYEYNMTKDIYVTVMGRGRDNVKRIFKKHFGDDLPIEEMYVKKDKMLEEAVKNNRVPLKKGALEILQFLKNSGYKTALATSAKRNRMEMQITNSKLNIYFDALVSGEDIVNSKPDPEIFLKAAEKIGVAPKNCIVIEDSESGIEGAHKGNMTAFHVEDLLKPNENIIKNSYKQFKNLIEIKEYLKDSCF